MTTAIRLYVTTELAPGKRVGASPAQSHYLAHVMRRGIGDRVHLFNGRDGEWAAEIGDFAKSGANLIVAERIRPQVAGCDLWLLFAPVKRARLDLIAEKASELGAAVLWPVRSRRTNAARVNTARLAANAAQAAEQCGRLDVPEIRDLIPLDSVLADWPADRRLLLFDAAGGSPASVLPRRAEAAPDAILIGPEGGFAPSELDAMRKLPFVTPTTMGRRILRAETAAIAAMACWQALCGDWRA